MSNLNNSYYSKKLLEITTYFEGSSYQHLVNEARQAYLNRDYKKLKGIFEKFPNEFIMLEALTEKLKGKSIESNIKKITKNIDKVDIEEAIITTSSLLTHCTIEIKRNPEYKLLRKSIIEKLNKLINDAK